MHPLSASLLSILVTCVALILSEQAGATPVDELRKIGAGMLQSWERTKADDSRVKQTNRCTFPAITGGSNGDIVTAVAPSETQFRTGDRIVAIDGAMDAPFFEVLSAIEPGTTVAVSLLRDGEFVVEEAVCLDSSTTSSMIDRLYTSMSEGNAAGCLGVLEELHQVRGTNANGIWNYSVCEWAEKGTDPDWLKNEYPKTMYEFAIAEMNEAAWISVHEDPPFSDYEPKLSSYIEGLSARGFPELGAELEQQYEEIASKLSESD
ncbi:MAG: hypothetical protein MI865_10700 [Proteobacteria bacterium]|nr:hypothetical protein [Pseudomonadota bacterium]